MDPKWLDWAKRLQAISQNGLTYANNHFDVERFHQVEQVAAEILADKAGVEPQAVLELFSRQTDYATPKVDVRGVVFREDKILLVKETSDHKWSIPGGWADVGESPSESVCREVWEESGFRVRADKLLAVYDRSKHPHLPLVQYHIYKMFFLCEIVGGQPTLSNETEEVAFFGEHEIPELSITKILPEQIARMFELHRRGDLPVDFD
jgi:ADP-ribose pyrophosphatase YjhB (NUDIX family)